MIGFEVVRVFRWVDPHLGREVMGLPLPALETVSMGRKGLIDGSLPSGMDGLCHSTRGWHAFLYAGHQVL